METEERQIFLPWSGHSPHCSCTAIQLFSGESVFKVGTSTAPATRQPPTLVPAPRSACLHLPPFPVLVRPPLCRPRPAPRSLSASGGFPHHIYIFIYIYVCLYIYIYSSFITYGTNSKNLFVVCYVIFLAHVGVA